MRRFMKAFFLFFLIAIFCPAFGQHTDSVFSLPEATIFADRLYANSGFSHTLDTGNQSNTLYKALLFESTANIRRQSISGLSTVSLRGLPAAHTKTLWNGFAVQSPMNGVADLSLLPTQLFASVQLLSEAHSAYFGSGAIGGVIRLKPFSKSTENFAQLAYHTGSWGLHSMQVSAGLAENKNGQWLKVSAIHEQRKGNFSFPDRTQNQSPIRSMENAAAKIQAIMLSGSPLSLLNSPLEMHIWLQQSKRELPASLTEGSSLANQDDNAVRLAMNWRQIKQKSNHEVRLAWFYDDLVYRNPKIQLEAFSNSIKYMAEFSSMFIIYQNWVLKTALLFEHTTAFADDYRSKRNRRKINGFAAIQWQADKTGWQVEAGARLPWIDEKFTAWSPFLAIRHRYSQAHETGLNISGNYRHPTLNDLYWVPNGDPDLKSETSRQISLTHQAAFTEGLSSFKVFPSLYVIHVKNMIQWLNINSTWHPVNHPEVLSRGAELKMSYTQSISHGITMKITTGSAYTRAQLQTHPNENIVGNQLTFTPYQKHTNALMTEKGNYKLSIEHQYTGSRYTTSDQSASMPGFHLINMHLSGKLSFWKAGMSWHFKCNNLLNKYYEWFPYQPMPGRGFEAGIRVNFQST